MYYEWFAISDSSDIHFVAQGNIGPGAKLEDGKGTAASGAIAFFFKTVPLCNYKKYKVTCTACSGANSAMKMFQKRDELGTSDMSTKLNTTHQNQVSEVYLFLLWASLLGTWNYSHQVRHYSGDKASAGTLSTVAGDGKLVLWDLAALKLKGLKI